MNKEYLIKQIWDRIQTIEHDIAIGQSRKFMRIHLSELETYIEELVGEENPFPVTVK